MGQFMVSFIYITYPGYVL